MTEAALAMYKSVAEQSYKRSLPIRAYKHVMREVRGQLMQITDRREQYYVRRKAHDDAMNMNSSRKFRFPKRPAPYVSQRQILMQAQKKYNENYRKFVDSAEINKAP